MNVYRVIGDRVGTHAARELAQQLVAWHDAMVKHLRVGGRGECPEGCAHEEARALWAAAVEIFGEEASGLSFLRVHGGMPPPTTAGATELMA